MPKQHLLSIYLLRLDNIILLQMMMHVAHCLTAKIRFLNSFVI